MRTFQNSLLLLGAVVSSLSLAESGKPPLAATAEKIVGEVLGVREGEVVAIEADPGDQALIEELYVAIGKRGASPLPDISWPGLTRKWMQSVPAAHDAALATLSEKMLPLVDARIAIERVDDPALFRDVPKPRVEAYSQAFRGLTEKSMKRKVRVVSLGNGLSPSKANAKLLGLTEDELKKLFWAGVNTDYKALAARAETVRAAVGASHELTITTPAGTSIKVRFAAKPLSVSDGVISEEDAKQGGAALLTWLPAGEVYGLVDPASAEGKVVEPIHTYQGEEVKDLTLTIKAGKVTELTAKPSKAFERFKQAWDAGGPGKDSLSILDFGVNPDVKAPKGKVLRSYVPAGAVTFFLGNDVWAGGTNDATLGIPVFLPGATVLVDGKPLVERGELR
jgi:leucyl aminopeptidase (aminopeptidase T)